MKSLERLRSVPWHELEGFEQTLGPALDEVLAGKPADRVLDRFLKKHRDATAAQRTAFAEAIFGVGLWRRRLGIGSALELLQRLTGGHRAPDAFADRYSLPDWLAQEIQRAAGDEAEAFADALNLPGPICLRANTSRISRDALGLRLADEGVATIPGRFAPHCLVITSSRPNLYGLEAWNEALFEVQDEGSQLLGALVDAQPGEDILDLCAGAGGKTLQLANQLGNRGRVHATDVDLARLERLRTRATRAQATCISIHGRTLPADLRVARVLVDAPCSELGALRRGPDLRWRLDPTGFAPMPATQRALLDTAVTHLSPGGRLVYATCTFRREENEDLVAAFERDHPQLVRVPLAIHPDLVDPNGFLRTWPHRHGTDAFFASVHTLKK